MSFNFKTYRDALAKSKPPVIPYLGIFSKDLLPLEENNPDYVKEGDLQLVNFEKMRLLFRAIAQLYKSTYVQYPFERDPKIRGHLKNLKSIDEKEAYNLSLVAEPRV
eukprot:TRINITY_DN4631_c0_g1_i1.p1 TRINITY_DN4631_c0_g1~~TRINITY_DN4631_c0_g1_i1.p1  ORF type:complete len:107 (+),score=20.35 TRINITY_DN4631_c0_g1_i1:258-578(+)